MKTILQALQEVQTLIEGISEEYDIQEEHREGLLQKLKEIVQDVGERQAVVSPNTLSQTGGLVIRKDLPVQMASLIHHVITRNDDSSTTTRQAIEQLCEDLELDKDFADVLEACILYTRKGDPEHKVTDIDLMCWAHSVMAVDPEKAMEDFMEDFEGEESRKSRHSELRNALVDISYSDILREILWVVQSDYHIIRGQGTFKVLAQREGDGTCKASYADVKTFISLGHLETLLQSACTIAKDI